jgi:predicted house-cleaning noncanonical NTP pyrophosphatase (MazG superfamily)
MQRKRLCVYGAAATINMTKVKTYSIGCGLAFLDKLYNKAIRDKIPEIIKIKGETCELRRLTNTEFLLELEKKLHEELAEYDQNKSPEELADIIEVVYRIAELRGVSNERMEVIRNKKAQERGGFQENLFLVRTNSESNKEQIS